MLYMLYRVQSAAHMFVVFIEVTTHTLHYYVTICTKLH